MDDPNTRKKGEKDLDRGCEKKSRNSHVVSTFEMKHFNFLWKVYQRV